MFNSTVNLHLSYAAGLRVFLRLQLPVCSRTELCCKGKYRVELRNHLMHAGGNKTACCRGNHHRPTLSSASVNSPAPNQLTLIFSTETSSPGLSSRQWCFTLQSSVCSSCHQRQPGHRYPSGPLRHPSARPGPASTACASALRALCRQPV